MVDIVQMKVSGLASLRRALTGGPSMSIESCLNCYISVQQFLYGSRRHVPAQEVVEHWSKNTDEGGQANSRFTVLETYCVCTSCDVQVRGYECPASPVQCSTETIPALRNRDPHREREGRRQPQLTLRELKPAMEPALANCVYVVSLV